MDITVEDLQRKYVQRRRELGLPASTTPSRSEAATLNSAIPELVEGVCPTCKTTPVTGIRRRDGTEEFPRCAGCKEVAEAKEREAAERARREKLAAETEQRRANIMDLLVKCGVDPESDHLSASFETFDPRPDGAALAAAKKFVEDFRAGLRPTLFLYSERPGERIAPGSGKTHLAVAILRELLIAGDVDPRSARFVRETRMTITLRRMIGAGERPEDYLDALIRPDLLVLDDVGKAKTDGPWLRELLFELVAGREPRATIITSNYGPDQLEALDDWYAPLLSRWLGKGAAVCLSGPDRRLGRGAPQFRRVQ